MDYKISVPLKLEGTLNTRELGGYPGEGGSVTKAHRYLRSDGLHGLTQEDKKLLFDYGVRKIIDLRTHMEVMRSPYDCGPHILRYSFPLIDKVQSEAFTGQFPASMDEMYIGLLDGSKSVISEVLKVMVNAGDDCVLFHCTAGKDRTGILSMLLLMLAGVSDSIIVEDYAVTETYMASEFDKQKAYFSSIGLEVPDYVCESKAVCMEKAIEHLRKAYGNCTSYLKTIGLSEEKIETLKKRLI